MALPNRWWKALLLTATALLLAAVVWFLLPSRLSPLEQSLVGSWCASYGPPRNTTFVIDLHADRSCLVRKLDGSERGPGLHSQAGKWQVKDGVLVCDWRSGSAAVASVRIVPGGPTLGGVQLPSLRRVQAQEMGKIIEVRRDEVTLQWPDGTIDVYKRHEEPGSK